MNDVAAECLNSITLSIAKALDGGISEHAKEALRRILRVTIQERKKLYEGKARSGGEET
jgi:DNA helicase TIP49 (TBP-interacting protein)